MTKHEIDLFNKRVGRILSANRRRVSLSVNEVAEKIGGITTSQLSNFESGEKSPPCNVIHKMLTEIYSPTNEEVFFFCCPTASINKRLFISEDLTT